MSQDRGARGVFASPGCCARNASQSSPKVGMLRRRSTEGSPRRSAATSFTFGSSHPVAAVFVSNPPWNRRMPFSSYQRAPQRAPRLMTLPRWLAGIVVRQFPIDAGPVQTADPAGRAALLLEPREAHRYPENLRLGGMLD